MKNNVIVLVFGDKKLFFFPENQKIQIQELQGFLEEFFSAYFQERQVDFSSYPSEVVDEGFKVIFKLMKKIDVLKKMEEI